MVAGAFGKDTALLWWGMVCGTRSGRRDFKRLKSPASGLVSPSVLTHFDILSTWNL